MFRWIPVLLCLVGGLAAPSQADESTGSRAKPDEDVLPEVARIKAHHPWVRTLDVSQDGRWIATGGPDRTSAIWSVASRSEQARATLPPGKG